MFERCINSMDAYEVVESILDSKKGAIMGRSAIQKLVYLAQHIISGLDVPRFRSHYYGPSSPKLGVMLERLVSYCFVSETKVPGMMYEGYRYELTADGQEIIKTIKEEKRKKYDEIRNLVIKCDKFCELKSAPLSYASKILYMVHDDREKISIEDAIERAGNMNWRFPKDSIWQGVDLLKMLDINLTPTHNN